MQIPRLSVVVALICVSLANAAEWPAPPHPTMLFAEYEGKPHSVVAVEKEEPVILVDHKRKRLRGKIPLSTERLPRYSGAKAELKNVKAEVVQIVQANSDVHAEQVKSNLGATVSGYVEFEGTITSAQDLTDCFVVLCAFEDDFLRGVTDRPNAQIRVRQIRDLKSGEATRIKFATTPFLPKGKMGLFVLLFSGGDEVLINVQPLAAAYFHHRERLIHAATVRQWLAKNPTGSQPVRPVLQIPPLFASTEGFPPEATADLTVATDGTVLDLTLNRTFAANAEETIRSALGSWLFLPKIHEGAPVLTHVSVPLRF